VLATRAGATLVAIAALALAGAVVLGGGALLVPLALGAPFAAITLGFDLANRSRAAIAELAAPLALGTVAAAMARADGWTRWEAFGLWGILAARSLPTILYVRSRLRLERGEPAGIPLALIAQALGVAWALALAALGITPWVAAVAIAVLALRAALGLSPWRPRWTTRQIGASEAVLGGVLVLAVGLGTRFGG
jgi:hypothetical protein